MLAITVRQSPVRANRQYAMQSGSNTHEIGHELYLSKAPGGSQLVDFPERFLCFITIVQSAGLGRSLNQVGVFQKHVLRPVATVSLAGSSGNHKVVQLLFA